MNIPEEAIRAYGAAYDATYMVDHRNKSSEELAAVETEAIRSGLRAAAPLIAAQVLRSEPKIDTDWYGEFLRQSVTGGVVCMRRSGTDIVFATVGNTSCTLILTAEQADEIATSLASAAETVRQENSRERSPDDLFDPPGSL